MSYDYKYDSNGSLVRQSSSSGERYDYEYDSLGRLIRSEETRNGAFAQRTEHIYDAADRLTKQLWYNSGGTTTLAYTYNSSNGFISSLTYGGTADIAVNYTYNGVNQLGNKSAGGVYNKGYEYVRYNVVAGRNSSKNLVSKLTYSGKLSDTWSYTYDSNGRIASESHGYTNTYGYDGQGQLTSAKVNGTQYSYTYDTAGNITGKTIGSTSYNYEYNNPKWLDQLTGYNGGTITYDNCGNPLTYYDGSSFTWTQGRRLSGYTNGSTSIEFAYNMAGVRSSKTVGNTTYNYTTLSGLVTRQTWGSNSIDFLYDENNQPFAMKYNGTWYYYVLNVQGDVVKLIKADGTAVASYTYDPWGKILTSTGNLANINPLRYRGYYYDTETGLYYLQSRYYDPEIGRFINADSYTTTDSTGILSANMYAYCENDPVNRSDPSGACFFGGIFCGFGCYAATKSIIAIAGTSYLGYKGYGLSSAMFNHGMYGRGEELPQSVNGLIVDRLKDSKIMDGAISDLMKSVSGNSVNRNGTVEFTKTDPINADLYYSLQHISFNVRGNKANGVWHLTITVTDTYNFDNLRLFSNGLTFGNAANDLGWIMQRVGMMTPYSVEVSYQIQWCEG